jgi:hypothetical protein
MATSPSQNSLSGVFASFGIRFLDLEIRGIGAPLTLEIDTVCIKSAVNVLHLFLNTTSKELLASEGTQSQLGDSLA